MFSIRSRMPSNDDIQMAQAFIQAGVAARRLLQGDSEQVQAEQRLADAICERLDGLIDRPAQPPAA